MDWQNMDAAGTSLKMERVQIQQHNMVDGLECEPKNDWEAERGILANVDSTSGSLGMDSKE